MATTAVVGLSTGKRLLLGSTFYYSDLAEKLGCASPDPVSHHIASTKNTITAKKSPNFFSNQRPRTGRALVNVTAPSPCTLEQWLVQSSSEEDSDPEYLVDAVLLLQKSMLEKQWSLSSEMTKAEVVLEASADEKIQVTCSGTSARRRRLDTRKKFLGKRNATSKDNTSNQWRSTITPDLLQNHGKGYVKGVVSEELLTHTEVVQLSQKIKTGLFVEEQKSRYSSSFSSSITYSSWQQLTTNMILLLLLLLLLVLITIKAFQCPLFILMLAIFIS